MFLTLRSTDCDRGHQNEGGIFATACGCVPLHTPKKNSPGWSLELGAAAWSWSWSLELSLELELELGAGVWRSELRNVGTWRLKLGDLEAEDGGWKLSSDPTCKCACSTVADFSRSLA